MFTAEYYDDLRGRATALLIAVEPDLPAGQAEIMGEMIDHNEPGVAVEMLVAILGEAGAFLTNDQAAQVELLVQDMGLDESVSRQAWAMVQSA